MPTARDLWKATKAKHKAFDDAKKFKGNFGPLLDKWEKLDREYVTRSKEANVVWSARRKPGLDPKKKAELDKKFEDIHKKVYAKAVECNRVLHQANEVAKQYVKIADELGDKTMKVDMYNVFAYLAKLCVDRYEDAIVPLRALTPREVLFKDLRYV